MLDNGGDSVVLVSTIPSAFIVADDLVHQPQPLSAAARADVPRCSGPGPRAGGPATVLSDNQSVPSPDRRSSDDCSEITSTVADDPAAFAPVGSPSAASASPPPDYGKQSATAEVCEVVGSKLASTCEQSATASRAVTSTAELITSAMTSTSVTATTTTTSQQIGRQKKSLEMVVNLLKRPSTSSTSSSSSSATTTTCSAAEPARASSLPIVTSSSMVPTSGHAMLNGGAGDDSVGLSLLQRLVAMPPSAYWQPPVPTSSHFRFRSASMLPAARSAETGPPIKQLKHMCKNVRSFVPSAARRASQWQHPALNMLFGTAPRVPVTRHRAAAPPPPRAAVAYRGACVRSHFSRPRFHAPAAAHVATSGVSRERKQCSDGELSALMRVLLEASGNSCHTPVSSSSSSPSFPSTADLWKAAIN